ncbi:hypothetical protein ACOMHN_045549 [Nucella lapillus]
MAERVQQISIKGQLTRCFPYDFICDLQLGWNDIGFHNPDILSPNVDKLAKKGVIFDQAYVQSSCSP